MPLWVFLYFLPSVTNGQKTGCVAFDGTQVVTEGRNAVGGGLHFLENPVDNVDDIIEATLHVKNGFLHLPESPRVQIVTEKVGVVKVKGFKNAVHSAIENVEYVPVRTPSVLIDTLEITCAWYSKLAFSPMQQNSAMKRLLIERDPVNIQMEIYNTHHTTGEDEVIGKLVIKIGSRCPRFKIEGSSISLRGSGDDAG